MYYTYFITYNGDASTQSSSEHCCCSENEVVNGKKLPVKNLHMRLPAQPRLVNTLCFLLNTDGFGARKHENLGYFIFGLESLL